MNKQTKSNMEQKVNLAGTIIPPIPFVWYREEQFFCPFSLVSIVDPEIIKRILPEDITKQIDGNFGECYVLVQKNVLEKANLYACFHSYAYVKAHGSQEETVVIPPTFCKSYHFNAKLIPVDQFGGSKIKYDNHSFKEGVYSHGSVFIHDAAFSPPGEFRFRVDEQCDVNTFVVHAKCQELGLTTTSIFVLINCLKEGDNEEFIKEVVAKVEEQLKSPSL